MDQTGQQRGTADNLRRCHLGVARLHARLHGVERRLIDDWRHRHRDNFVCGLKRLRLAPLVELVPSDVGLAGQHAVNGADSPAPAVTREDAAFVEVFGDGLDAHGAGSAVSRERQPKRQPYRLGVQRVDLQLLLDLGPALLGGDNAVADRRQ
ncbi:MAG: hypothetical protein APF78_05215 [Sphingomonadales bacterium BRH_c3]|nr:MAG: hypothetical protein APF78_05215 [Sphingomonadales bacterium BRH_c3]